MSLELRDVVVRRSGYVVLNGITVSVAEGEVVGILGRNGAGKTTLVEAIAGLIRSVTGQVSLFGEDVTGIKAERAARRGIALVPERRRLFVSMSVVDNLLMGDPRGRRILRRPSGEGLDLVYSLFPALHDSRSRLAGSLSGGQQQMLAIGRALMSFPKVLLVDEPSFGLSPKVVDDVCEKLRSLREDGMSMIVAEQNIDVAAQVASRIGVLDGGRLIGDPVAPSEAFFGSKEVRTALFGEYAGPS